MCFCKLCKHNYSYIGNTTNSCQHLEEKHIEEFRQAKEDAKQTSESESSSDKSTTQQEPHIINQPTINEVLPQKQPYPRNSARLKILNDSVSYFISKDTHYSRSAGNKLNWVFKNYYNTKCDSDSHAVYM